MASDERRPPVPAAEVFGRHLITPIPEGTSMTAAFVLVRLDNDEWSARQVGDTYNRTEFLGQLSAYTHSLLQSEADDWYEDEDDDEETSVNVDSQSSR